MGNAAAKESRGPGDSAARSGSGSGGSNELSPSDQMYYSRAGRSSRHDISFLGMGGRSDQPGDPNAEPRRETRQEREARRAERDRVARLKERERSMKEESVDGGYVVTIGTYTGVEDFNKGIVRQLMIERRLAPFWRGLNDHSDSWTEHQLVAAARGLPIPAPDEIPPEELSSPPTPQNGLADTSNTSISIPVQRRHASEQSLGADGFSNLSASHPAFSTSSAGPSSFPSPSPLFRGRAKTLVSLTSKNSSQTDITPQEIRLPADPRINGQPVEAYLYKDASECPICFLYYPPYLNKTRCCDQPICSECFVQVKRPDPHPPEHLDPNNSPPPEPRSFEDEIQLVSEAATCPFCKTPEFGVSYDAPPFRRGLAYAGHGVPMARTGSAMSSTSSLSGSNGSSTPTGRRRTVSLSANDTSVITTDRIRPEWATKLAQAKAQAARRAASATALHTAAYMMGPGGSGLLSRRRRGETRGEGPSQSNLEQLLAILEGQEAARSLRRENSSGNEGGRGLFGSRRSSRTDDIEELMMMEAIRQSIAAEEERKRKEEKEAAKQQKKEEKQRAKEQKKADKVAKKNFGNLPSPAESSFSAGSISPIAPTAEEEGKGKGREASSSEIAARLAFNPMNEPTSTLHADSRNDPQRHLEQSRAVLDQTQHQIPGGIPQVTLTQHRSSESSLNSSSVDSPTSSFRNESISEAVAGKAVAAASSSGPGAALGSFTEEASADGSPKLDPAFNFGSLAAIIDKPDQPEGSQSSNSPGPAASGDRGNSQESARSSSPPQYEEKQQQQSHSSGGGDDIIMPVQQPDQPRSSMDQKYRDDVTLVEQHSHHETA